MIIYLYDKNKSFYDLIYDYLKTNFEINVLLTDQIESEIDKYPFFIISDKPIYSDKSNIIYVTNELGQLFHIRDLIGLITDSLNSRRSFKIGEIGFYPYRKILVYKNSEISLTETEMKIIDSIIHSENEQTTRQNLISYALKYNTEIESNSIENHIYKINQKMDNLKLIINNSNTYHLCDKACYFFDKTS